MRRGKRVGERLTGERVREQRGNEDDKLGMFGQRNGCEKNNGAKGGRESWLRQMGKVHGKNGRDSWEE